VANENQDSSRATVDIGVSYDVDLDRAIAVLQQAANDAVAEPAWQEHVQRPPEVSGVQELADDVVDIRVIAWVSAGQRRKFERHLRRKLKDAIDAAGLHGPNQQIDVWLRQEPSAA
jgi:small conductance mechanosensitive channel